MTSNNENFDAWGNRIPDREGQSNEGAEETDGVGVPQPEQAPQYGQYGSYGYNNPTGQYESYPSGGNANQPGSYGQYNASDVYGSPQGNGYEIATKAILPSHPMSVGELLDAGMRILRVNPGAMIGFPALVTFVGTAISVLVSYIGADLNALETADSWEIAATWNSGTFGLIATFVISIITMAMLANFGSRASLASARGKKLNFSQAIALSFERLWSVLWRILVVYLLLSLLFAIIFGVVMLIASQDSAGAIVVMVPVMVIVVLYVSMRVIVVNNVLVLEDAGPIRSLTRSIRLTKGSVLQLVGLSLLVILIMSLAGTVFSVFLSLVMLLFVNSNTGAVTILLTSSVFSGVIFAILTPYLLALQTSIYISLRMKRDNVNLLAG